MREGNGGHARATHHSQFQFELPKGGRISRASWQMVFHVICAHADDDLLWKEVDKHEENRNRRYCCF